MVKNGVWNIKMVPGYETMTMTKSPPIEQPSYELRGLTDHDITRWAQFCSECFAYKPNPPLATYFLRHYENDPRKDSSLIRVMLFSSSSDDKAEDETSNSKHNKGRIQEQRDETRVIKNDLGGKGDIASSVRIFQKTISMGGTKQAFEAGGIGEVCTSDHHRKRGLVRQLLHDAIDVMSSQRNMQCSLLHAGPSLVPFYEKIGGYTSIISKWSVLSVNVQHLDDSSNDENIFLNIRLVSFPSDTPSLQKIHQRYSEERFIGCIIRSTEYWNEYLKHEIGHKLYVLTSTNSSSSSSSILAWISIRSRNGRFQICDFGIDLEESYILGLTTSQVLSKLLRVSLINEGIQTDSRHSNFRTYDNNNESIIKQTVELHLPTAIVEEMKGQNDFNSECCKWVDWSIDIYNDDDVGWMYKLFPQNMKGAGNDDDGDDTNSCLDMQQIAQKSNLLHLIWPSDSF